MTYEARETSQWEGEPVECYRFARLAATWYYTSADRTITNGQGVFRPSPIRRGPISQNNEQGSGSVEVRMPRDVSFVAQYVAYLPTARVTLQIFRQHRDDAEVLAIFSGEVTGCDFDLDRDEAVFNCTPIGYRLKKKIPQVICQSPCNYALYGTGCGVDRNGFKLTGPVASVGGTAVAVASFSGHPDQWLTNGWIERADGDRRFIVDHQGETVQLDAPFPDLSPGESVTAYAGCDRTEAMCTTKFDNLHNHLGWARVPTHNPFDSITEWQLGNAAPKPRSIPRFRAGGGV